MTGGRRYGVAGCVLAVTLLALVWGLAGSASPASAHARYDHSDPADGAILTAPPSRVDVFFVQDVRRSGGLPTLIVVNQSGDALNAPAVLDDSDRKHMLMQLPPALPDGRYTVIWHTLSDEDGEEAQGAFFFTIASGQSPSPGATTSGTATPSESATPKPSLSPAPTPPSSTSDSDNDVPVWALVLGVVVSGVAAGGAGFAVGRRSGR